MAAALLHELHIRQEYLALADRNEPLGTLPPKGGPSPTDSVRGSVAYLKLWLTFLEVSAATGTASTAAPFDTAAEFHALHNNIVFANLPQFYEAWATSSTSRTRRH